MFITIQGIDGGLLITTEEQLATLHLVDSEDDDDGGMYVCM